MRLELGPGPFETIQPLVIAQEMASRTRNMHIERLYVYCIECAAPFMAYSRDTYDDGRPCRISSVRLGTNCALTIDVKALLQPFIFTIGVTSYEIVDFGEWDDDEVSISFEALWSAWDRSKVEMLELHLTCPQMFTWLVDRMLVEQAHKGRRYLLYADDFDLQTVVESYVEVGSVFF